jgi:hypothetical protein
MDNTIQRLQDPTAQIPAILGSVAVFTLVGYFVDGFVKNIEMFKGYRLQVTIFLSVVVWDLLAHQLVQQMFGRDFCQVLELNDQNKCNQLLLQSVALHGAIFVVVGSVIHTVVRSNNPDADLDQDNLVVKILASTALVLASIMAFVKPTMVVDLFKTFDLTGSVEYGSTAGQSWYDRLRK